MRLKHIITKITDMPYTVAAALAMLGSSSALAQQTGGIATLAHDTWTHQLSGIGSAVCNGGAVAGLVYTGAGLLKLKAAADSQGQQVKYAEGLWRIGVGGALSSLPFVAGIANTTVDGDSASSVQWSLPGQ